MPERGSKRSAAAALVTGAGSGIGRAIAEQVARAGYSVALAGRNAERLRDTARAIDAAQGSERTLIVPTDLSQPDQVERMVDQAIERFGRLDLLVNNAGEGRLVPIRASTPELMREFVEVNALAPAAAVLRAWPIFERQRSGCVVNVSSMATLDPFPGFFAYGASKAAMNVMTKSIAKEGAAIGVRAYCIAPGAVETPLLRRTFDRLTLPPEICLSPDDVASLILDCIAGRRDEPSGSTLAIVREPTGVRIWPA